MDKCIDDNLTDLHIISLIKEGVKIYVRNGRIAHQQPKGENVLQNMWGSTKRWFYNDNRRSGVDEIYNIVNPANINVTVNTIPRLLKFASFNAPNPVFVNV